MGSKQRLPPRLFPFWLPFLICFNRGDIANRQFHGPDPAHRGVLYDLHQGLTTVFTQLPMLKKRAISK